MGISTGSTPRHILDIFFGGDESTGFGFTGGVKQFVDFAIAVMVMISEGLFTNNGEPPVFEVEKKSSGIADATRNVERTFGGKLLGSEKLGIAPEFTKTEQTSVLAAKTGTILIWRWRLRCQEKCRCG